MVCEAKQKRNSANDSIIQILIQLSKAKKCNFNFCLDCVDYCDAILIAVISKTSRLFSFKFGIQDEDHFSFRSMLQRFPRD